VATSPLPSPSPFCTTRSAGPLALETVAWPDCPPATTNGPPIQPGARDEGTSPSHTLGWPSPTDAEMPVTAAGASDSEPASGGAIAGG